MEPYRYTRLKRPGDGQVSFRLATLCRGLFDDDVYVTINEVSSDSSGNIRSEKSDGLPTERKWFALSYTWGDLGDRSKVIVRSDRAGNRTDEQTLHQNYISVTRNLTQALRHIRCPHEERNLWIDALCIDQSDEQEALDERAAQVRSMHRIYSQATGVIIWLGEDADDSTYALGSLHRLGSSIHVDWTTFEILTQQGKPTESMEIWNDQERAARDCKAVANLLERPWFDRVWIRQEAFFAKEGTSAIFCGDAILSFAEFRKAIHYLSVIGLNDLRAANRLALVLSVCQREYSDIPNLLRRIRASQCRDPRDKVYGILGMVALQSKPELELDFPVEYSASHSVEQVYKDFFLRYRDRYGTLRLLDESGISQGSDLRPTWIPDLRSNIIDRQLDLSLESAVSHFVRDESQFQGPGTLKCFGRRAAHINRTFVVEESKFGKLDQKLWRKLAQLLHSLSNAANREMAIERFTRALSCVLNPLRIALTDLEKVRDSIRQYVEYLYGTEEDIEQDVKAPNEVIDEQAAQRLEQAVRYLIAKQAPLIFSAEGQIGVGPIAARPGDEVWAILGSRSLILLRGAREGGYEVVGSCFMHGSNWGETILGPLPEHYTVVQRYEETRRAYFPYYLDTKTGLSSMWDPRVKWDELEAHPPMVNFVPVTAPPGEPFRVRPNSSYLRRHCIDISQIDLI